MRSNWARDLNWVELWLHIPSSYGCVWRNISFRWRAEFQRRIRYCIHVYRPSVGGRTFFCFVLLDVLLDGVVYKTGGGGGAPALWPVRRFPRPSGGCVGRSLYPPLLFFSFLFFSSTHGVSFPPSSPPTLSYIDTHTHSDAIFLRSKSGRLLSILFFIVKFA
jgi:hypothetical protein